MEQPWSYWFILSFVLLGLELATGTLFLLILAGGSVAGALVAWWGLPLLFQFGATALVSLFFLLLLRKKFLNSKSTRLSKDKRQSSHLNPDIGQTIMIEAWLTPAPTRAKYRGSTWDVAPVSGYVPQPGAHRIVAMEANTLILEPIELSASDSQGQPEGM